MKQSELSGGFTLLETLLGMFLLTVGALWLMSIIMSGLSNRENVREYDIANNAAITKLEEIRAYDFQTVTAFDKKAFTVPGLFRPTNWPPATNPCPPRTSAQPWQQDELAWLVGYVTIDTSRPELYDVTITIRWRISNIADERVFNEFIARRLVAINASK